MEGEEGGGQRMGNGVGGVTGGKGVWGEGAFAVERAAIYKDLCSDKDITGVYKKRWRSFLLFGLFPVFIVLSFFSVIFSITISLSLYLYMFHVSIFLTCVPFPCLFVYSFSRIHFPNYFSLTISSVALLYSLFPSPLMLHPLHLPSHSPRLHLRYSSATPRHSTSLPTRSTLAPTPTDSTPAPPLSIFTHRLHLPPHRFHLTPPLTTDVPSPPTTSTNL